MTSGGMFRIISAASGANASHRSRHHQRLRRAAAQRANMDRTKKKRKAKIGTRG